MSHEKKPNRVHEHPMTYEDYANLPDDGQRYELVDGQLELMSPSPILAHQMIVGRLTLLLSQGCMDEYAVVPAPIDVVLSENEVRQPDLVMIHLSRISVYKARGCIVEPPDLVVEILSPTSFKRDKIDKRHAYAKFGVPEYWVINPIDESLEQLELEPSGQYALTNVYTGDEPVKSDNVRCVDFSMDNLMSLLRNLPAD